MNELNGHGMYSSRGANSCIVVGFCKSGINVNIVGASLLLMNVGSIFECSGKCMRCVGASVCVCCVDWIDIGYSGDDKDAFMEVFFLMRLFLYFNMS